MFLKSLKSSKTTPSAAVNQTISPQITNCNAKIRRFCEVGSLKEAVDTLCKSPKWDLELGTYCLVLQLCAERKSLRDGRRVHSVISSNSWQVDSVLGAKLVFMYVNCGDLATGREIFDQIANEKVYLWNILINEYAKVGNFGEGICLYHKMKEFGVVPNSYTFSCVLKCFSGLGFLEEGRKAHVRLLKLHLDTDTAVVNSLINFYFKCRRVNSAQKLFVKLLDRDIISWNSMISGFASNDLPEKGLEIFDQMLQAGLVPNLTTVTCVLAACADISVLEFGRMLHGYVLKTGFARDLTCNNTLLDMYAKCGDLDSAIQVFENMVDRSVVSCTSMIAAYAREGLSHAAIRLFHEMRDGALRPDAFTVSTVLNACASSNLLDNGKEVHDYVTENKMQSNVSICNALMDMYMKCGSIEDAQSVFSQMSARDTISWNTMIAGYSKNGRPNEALNLFLEMQHQSKPDCITMSCILPSCASLAALERGKEIHAHILRNGQIDDIYVANALVDMYMKCGALILAHLAFGMVARRDLISWTIMTAGYCLHGLANEAMSSFNEMRNEGIEPDENSFSSILYGCCHSGLLNEGRQFFTMMEKDCGIKPKLEHYTCMVDLLANAGRLTEAYRFIEKMPLKADAAVWGALLQGCRIHHNLKLAEKVAEHIFELEPDSKASYMRLANIYSEAKIWDKVKWLKDKIGHLGKEKNQVCSWIVVKGKVQIFFAGNVASHPESKNIETFLKKLKCRMNGENYIRSTKYAMMDKDEVEKEVALCGHSELSAMAFGLLNLSRGNTIRVTKNSRICRECHDMAKFISKTLGREIILRDSHRFHHFKDALCSCRG
ncbi:hypothetical protein Cgig2_033753 [Carnegiea gigantea]|uniref:DYW domain-containing protein n=1 Tax=Carnegiea gigantea TaxID=171969 RepID=A0A9Q1QAA6_9CARY|nr:hypothetical protein Cgig2_033753 [Carnegiea gigantea]